MTAITIVSDDAERLVREGGVINRDEEPPDDPPQWYACVECDHRMRQSLPHLTPNAHYAHDPSGIGGEWHEVKPDGPCPFTADVIDGESLKAVDDGRAAKGTYTPTFGTVRVVDVHHADDCAVRHTTIDPRCFTRPRQFPPGALSPNPPTTHCHPDAEPNCWHWTVVPIDQGDDE